METPHLKNLEKRRREINIMTNEYPHLVFYEIVYLLVKNALRNSGLRKLQKIIDTSTIAVNKLIRTPYSINNSSFLPVVYVDDLSELSLDYIITVVREPKYYKVWFKNSTTVRIEYKYRKISTRNNPVVIDEYEFMRQVYITTIILKNL